MTADIVFRPQPADLKRKFRQTAIIAAGFFLFAQAAFLEGAAVRIAFTAFFVVFLALGAWLVSHSARNWPQEVRLNERGITYASLRRRHGVDWLPWGEIAKLDLFHTHLEGSVTAPFLRIGLRRGPFRDRLRRPAAQRFGLGLDVNIPLAVDVEPEVVLETARKLWERHRSPPAAGREA